MGYRARLGKIAKSERNKYRGKTSDVVEKIINDEDTSLYRLKEHTQLFELGKYIDYFKDLEPFYDFDIREEYESEFHIMTKDNLMFIIDAYHDNTYQYYQDLQKNPDELERFIKGKVNEWDRKWVLPYYLDQEKTDGFIVASWKYEYSIFNLVYIYKTFDWENDYLIYSAW